ASARRPAVNTFAGRPPCPELAPRLKSAPKLEKTTRPKIPLARHLPTPIPLPLQAKPPALLPLRSRIWAGWRPASHNQGTACPAKRADASSERSPRIDFARNATTKRQGTRSNPGHLGPDSQL